MTSYVAPTLTSVEVAGVCVHPLDTAGVLTYISYRLNRQQACHIATVNPEFIVRARRDPGFRAVLDRCHLRTVDGIGVALALRWTRGLRVARVTGADLLLPLARLMAESGESLFLLGAGPGVAAAAAVRLGELCPEVRVAGVLEGSPDPIEDEQTCAIIRESGARVLLVAFGAPAQEVWIARNLPRLGPCVAIGVGGALDYLSGAVPRAPLWVRRCGLEWLYRLIRQPRRLRRQLALPVFVYLVAGQAVRERRRRISSDRDNDD